jgi:hypothetical protein
MEFMAISVNHNGKLVLMSCPHRVWVGIGVSKTKKIEVLGNRPL